MKKRVLITGSAGFVGSHIVEHILKNTDWVIVGLDSFRHRGDSLRVQGLDPERYEIITHDLTTPISKNLIAKIGHVDYVIGNASLSDVDESIRNPRPFCENNVNVALTMLEYCRETKPEKYIHVSCYDKDTRALTKNGLKFYHELKEGDIVFTLNENKEIEEKPIKKIIKQRYKGNMIKLSNGLIDMNVTPNHRMYDNNMTVQEADNLLNMKNYNSYVLPIPQKYKGKNNPIEIDGKEINLYDLFYLCGAYLGDGFCAYQEKETENKSGLTREEFCKRRNEKGQFISGKTGNRKTVISKSWRIFFDVPENNKARKRLEETLSNIGIKYSAQKGKSGEHIYVTSEAWLKFFKQFGKGEKNKTIPDWMLEYDYKYLECLFDGLLDTDGNYSNNGYRYTTSSIKLMEKICELGFKIGKYPKSYFRYSESYMEGRKISGYAYDIVFGRRPKSIKTNRINVVDYDDYIWCITVENKNFLTERNGAFAFSGNTDEVYGAALNNHNHREWETHLPSNPYSGSKAAMVDLSISYWRTYGVPLIITETMNIVGERQDKTKFLPMLISKINNGETVIIHGSPGNIGSRFYLHARNQADGLLFLLKNRNPEKYQDSMTEIIKPDRFNIVGEKELNNLELAQLVANIMGKKLNYKFEDFHRTRPGHDRRYALDGTKMNNLGWVPPVSLEQSIEKTIKWTLDHPEWLV